MHKAMIAADANEGAHTRVIAVSLDEQEWKAFLSLEPRPVEWLKDRIREHLGARSPAGARGPGA